MMQNCQESTNVAEFYDLGTYTIGMKGIGNQLEPTQNELISLMTKIEGTNLPVGSKEIMQGDADLFSSGHVYKNCSTRHGCTGATNCDSCYGA